MAGSNQESVATGWEKWNDWNARNMRPVMDFQCRAAGIAAGQRVLDLACGVGLPALQAAELVGASGRVLGVDVSSEMVDAALRIARARGTDNIEFRVMDAHHLDLPDQSFDAATFSFGLMFCADRQRALSELLRVLAPGARFALAVWGARAENPFFTTVFRTVEEFLPAAPAPSASLAVGERPQTQPSASLAVGERPQTQPSGPGMFDLGQPGALEALMHGAGIASFSIERVPMLMEFESLEQHFELFADMAPPVQRAARNLPGGALADLKRALARALEPYMDGPRVRLPAAALVASAQVPRTTAAD